MTATTNLTTTEDGVPAPINPGRLTGWFRKHGRHDLPWRQTRDPYAIVVSEVMLQQTQVARVIPYWLAWMERWPDVVSLANASRADVIRAWAGLGYNNRAVRLHEMARVCAERNQGRVPVKVEQLRGLPGVGEYTADAVACFSGEGSAIPLDTNVARVLARAAHGVSRPELVARARLRDTAAALAAVRGDVRNRGTALMDLGATVCIASAPKCADCPIAVECRWRALGYPEAATREKASERFEDSARWARGRIVARLREGAVGEGQVRSWLPVRHQARGHDYIEGLIRDGLVERVNGDLRLAGDQTISMASPKL